MLFGNLNNDLIICLLLLPGYDSLRSRIYDRPRHGDVRYTCDGGKTVLSREGGK